MKRLSLIILAAVLFVAGCAREDDITPITPPQPEKAHVQRIYTEVYTVLERLNPLTGNWDTIGQVHQDKNLFKELFWTGDRLDSIIESPYQSNFPYTIRFTYDDKGLLIRDEYFVNGSRTGQYTIFQYDAEGRLSKFEYYTGDSLSRTGLIDSYVGDKISHLKYKDVIYDVDISYIYNAGNVTEMVVSGKVDDKNLHVAYTFTYDDHPNPYSSCLYDIVSPREPEKWINANNILTEFSRTVEGDMEARDTRIEYVYQYENNLPVEKAYVSYTGTMEARMTTTNKEYYEY